MIPPASRIYLIIPVHNRRAVTLGCLLHLRRLGVLDWARVVVVDDGSTDGTGEAVASTFPEVTLLRGDGGLWWTGAIVLGMRHALADSTTAAVIWLNDDCRPTPGSLERLRDTAIAGSCIAVGQVFGEEGRRHGGLRKRWHRLEPATCAANRIVSVATMNGNCVCVPTVVTTRAGLPDATSFPQAGGDTDYGFRCRRLGIDIRLVGSACCVDVDPVTRRTSSWLHGNRSPREILRSFRSPKNYYYPPAWWRLNLRHWGALGPALFLAPYYRFALIALIRMIVPARLLRRRNQDPASSR